MKVDQYSDSKALTIKLSRVHQLLRKIGSSTLIVIVNNVVGLDLCELAIDLVVIGIVYPNKLAKLVLVARPPWLRLGGGGSQVPHRIQPISI